MDGRGRATDNIFVERLWRRREVRGNLSLGLRRQDRCTSGAEPLFPDVQHGAAASGSWKTYAGRGIFRPELKKCAAPQGGGKDQSKTVLDPIETLAYIGPKVVQLMGGSKDNAVMESFFATLKRELVVFENFLTREEAKAKIFEYIKVFYNRQRRHSTLGYLSPVEFEEVNKVS